MDELVKGKVDAFCEKCDKDQREYKLKKEVYVKKINGKKYRFYEYVAYCQKCGCVLDLPGLIDKNISYMDQQYRKKERIISISDMERCLSLYNLSKESFAKTLGIGEATIHRYFKGQIPSKEYSDRIRSVMNSFCEMNRYLEKNKSKLTSISYNKAKKKVKIYKTLFDVNEPKLLGSISILLRVMREATDIQIQKLLYYCQGVFMGIYKKPLFKSDCLAGEYGPVYSDIDVFLKKTKCYNVNGDYMPLLQEYASSLSLKEIKVIVMVAKTFGNYSAAPLIKMTCAEMPWKNARCDNYHIIMSDNVITKKSIQEYFDNVGKRRGLTKKNNINEYIKIEFNKCN